MKRLTVLVLNGKASSPTSSQRVQAGDCSFRPMPSSVVLRQSPLNRGLHPPSRQNRAAIFPAPVLPGCKPPIL